MRTCLLPHSTTCRNFKHKDGNAASKFYMTCFKRVTRRYKKRKRCGNELRHCWSVGSGGYVTKQLFCQTRDESCGSKNTLPKLQIDGRTDAANNFASICVTAPKGADLRGLTYIFCLPDLSVNQMRYGASFEVELMIGHKAVLGILPCAHILYIQAHARVTRHLRAMHTGV